MLITLSMDEQTIDDLRRFTKNTSKSGVVKEVIQKGISWKRQQQIKVFGGRLKLGNVVA